MGDGQPKQIVAAKYQQTTSRATPDAVARELRKLPAASGPLDSRKRALHDLAHALAYVQEQHKTKVVETCTKEDAASLLLTLLADIDAAPPVPASEDVIRVGRRVLGMGPMDARLYVLSCFVNLSYLGGAGILRLPPSGMTASGAPSHSLPPTSFLLHPPSPSPTEPPPHVYLPTCPSPSLLAASRLVVESDPSLITSRPRKKALPSLSPSLHSVSTLCELRVLPPLGELQCSVWGGRVGVGVVVP